jgi:hypothetical protein
MVISWGRFTGMGCSTVVAKVSVLTGSLAELAVLASTPVNTTVARLLLVQLRLTPDTQSHARNRLATGLRNSGIAFFTTHQAFSTGYFTAGTLDGILYGGVNLILNCPVTAPAPGHVILLKF